MSSQCPADNEVILLVNSWPKIGHRLTSQSAKLA
jgi:hypothetical protein